MAAVTVTFEAVCAAAAALEAESSRVSVRNVMKRLKDMIGIEGSPNTVTKLLNDYKAGRPLVRVADIGLDPGITNAIASQMQKVADQAAAASEERAVELEDNIALLMESQTAIEQQVAQLTVDLETSVSAAADLAAQLKESKADAGRQAELHAHEASDLRQELARERMRADKSAGDLARAEVRLEALPGLQTELERLRGLLESQTSGRVVAEQSVAVLTARLEAAREQIQAAEAREKEASDRASASSAQVAQLTGELTSTRVQVQSQQVALDAAAREVETSKVALKEAQVAAKGSGEEAAQLRGQVAQMQMMKEKEVSKAADKSA